MNTICEKQNKPENIELLAAQRHLYSKGKNVFYIRCVFVFLFLILSFVPISNDQLNSLIALGAVIYLFLDMLWLKKQEEHSRETAAKIQELFDTRVLELNWNTLLLENKPDNEMICEAYEKYKKSNPNFTNLKDWYATNICSTQLKTGRVLCQRCNIVWDSRQRRGLVKWLIGLSILQTVAVFVIAMTVQLTVNQVMLSIILPLLPAYALYLEQIDSHLKSAKRLDALKVEADRLIDISLNANDLDMQYQSRILQDEIFNHRKACPTIPDWFYLKMRHKGENEMYYNVSAKLRELGVL